MKKKKIKNRIKPKKNYILRIAVAAFIMVTIVDQQIKIQQSRNELENVNNQLEMAQMKTLDLEKKSQLAEQASKLTVSEVKIPNAESSTESSAGEESSGVNENSASNLQSSNKNEESSKNKTDEQKECEEYLRQEALRLGYAKSGVRVFQNIAGN